MEENAVSLEKKERLPLRGFNRQVRLSIEIPKYERYAYLVIGIGLAGVDVTFTWLQFQELSGFALLKFVFGFAGVLLGALNFLIFPLSLKLFPKGIWFRAIPLLIFGLLLSLVDIGATIGFMSSTADNEESHAESIKNSIQNKNVAITALSQSIKSSTESERIQRETQRAFNDIGRLSKANVSGSTLLQIEKNKAKAAENLFKMANEKPSDFEQKSQLTSLYSSVANIFSLSYRSARKWCEIIFSVIIPFGSICALTLGKNPAKITPNIRKDDDMDRPKADEKDAVQNPVVLSDKPLIPHGRIVETAPSSKAAEVVPIVPNTTQNNPAASDLNQLGLVQIAIDLIKDGKITNLSYTNLQDILKCGSDSSSMVRKELIKKGYAIRRGNRLMVNPKKVNKNV